MKSREILFCVAAMFASCSEDNDQKPSAVTWKKLGLNEKTINEMDVSGTTLYVATTSGLFKKQIDSEESDFLLIGFDNKNVEAIEVISDDQIFVSLFEKDGSEPPGLYKSSDEGQNWTPVDSDFGGANPEPVFDLVVHPDDNNVLYAAGYTVIAKSSDQGQAWEPIYGDWGGFATGISVVQINPNATEEIWAGGQGGIENGFLIRSDNETDWDIWNDLAENPTVVKEITFHRGDRAKVLVGFEGALLKTDNSGETWETLIDSDNNRFYFGIRRSQGDPDRIYAGGWLKTPDPQPLVLSISKDEGQSWEDFTFQAESYGGILEMQMINQEDKDVLFLGLDKGGVYKVTVPLF